MKNLTITYGPWLAMVVIWNFGYPYAGPATDVAAAAVLAGFSAVYHGKINKKRSSTDAEKD